MISEAGGQWIGPGQTAIADLARELEIGTFDTYYKGETVVLADGRRVAKDLHGTIGANPTVAANLSRLAREAPSGTPWKAANAAELDKLSLSDWLANPEARLRRQAELRSRRTANRRRRSSQTGSGSNQDDDQWQRRSATRRHLERTPSPTLPILRGSSRELPERPRQLHSHRKSRFRPLPAVRYRGQF